MLENQKVAVREDIATTATNKTVLGQILSNYNDNLITLIFLEDKLMEILEKLNHEDIIDKIKDKIDDTIPNNYTSSIIGDLSLYNTRFFYLNEQLEKVVNKLSSLI